MGQFADHVHGGNMESGWEGDWTPAALENEWHIFVHATFATASGALLEAPGDSKERALYEKAVKEVGAARKTAEPRYNKPRQTDESKKNLVRQLLNGYDERATLIQNHGMLYLKALEAERVFRGDWAPDGDNAVPEAHAMNCNTYNLKHFGADNKAARYLGQFDKNYKLVKALEEKAIASGLAVPGSYIFRFDEQLGWDGENGARGTVNSRCIRVDSVGTTQHSHPLPEEGTGFVSHEKLVCTAIVEAVENKDLERFLEIAKYLTLIGAGQNEFRMPGQDLRQRLKKALKEPGAILPACKFWSE